MKPNIKVERISLRNSLEFIAKWKNTFAFQQKFGCCPTIYGTCPEIHQITIHKPKTRLSPFFNKLFRVDDKGIALQSNSIKRQSVSGHISREIIRKNRTE